MGEVLTLKCKSQECVTERKFGNLLFEKGRRGWKQKNEEEGAKDKRRSGWKLELGRR